MSFSYNLKRIRKDKNLTQEELAEMLNVSRQAVSKWEQKLGYPEIETLFNIANQLDVSLDTLMSEEMSESDKKDISNITGKIVIKAYDHQSFATCSKISSGKLYHKKERKDYANYALWGVEGTGFFGGNYTLLGLYLNKGDIDKEVEEILNAMKKGISYYELKYANEVIKQRGKFKIVK